MLKLAAPDAEGFQKSAEMKFQLGRNKEIYLTHSFELSSPIFWSPSNPKTYLLTAEISRSEHLVDRTTHSIALDDIKVNGDSLLLNNQNFKINGVTYYPIFEDYGGLISYDQMEKDIKLIRATGFNSVRIRKKNSTSLLISFVQRYGLLPFIELPINSVPSSILAKEFLTIEQLITLIF